MELCKHCRHFITSPTPISPLPRTGEPWKRRWRRCARNSAANTICSIGGERLTTGDMLRSVNPSNPQRSGRHASRATAELARRAVESAYAYFPNGPHARGRAHPHAAERAAAIIRRAQAGVRRLAGLRGRQNLARSRSRRLRSHRFLRILRARDAAAGRSASPSCNCPANTTKCATCRWAWAW